MHFTYTFWGWLTIGALLMLAEIVSPGFVIFFFGLAAATVALAVAFVPDLSATWQLALVSVFSVAYLLGLRRLVKGVFRGDTERQRAIRDEYAGRVGRVVATIRPDVPGRVLLGDAEWAAVAAERLEPGTEVKVTGRSNLTMTVKKVEE